MGKPRRHRLHSAPLLASLVLAACGSRVDAGSESGSADDPATGDVPAVSTTLDGGGTPGLELVLPDAASAVDASSGPPSDLTLPESPPAPEPPATTSQPTAPGTYQYAVTGTVGDSPAFGLSTLDVSEVDDTRRQVHTETSPGGTTTTTYRLDEDGRSIESISIEAGPRRIDLVASEPTLLVPVGSVAGEASTVSLSGDRAVAEITFTLLELDSERMIFRTSTRLAAQIDAACQLSGTILVTAAARTTDQLPLDVRTESEMTTVGDGCDGRTISELRALLAE